MVDVGRVGSQVIGIAGMGIGIGILAHTARNVTRMTDEMYGKQKTRSKRPVPRRSTRRSTFNIPRYW